MKVIFLNHIASVLSERGLRCGAVYHHLYCMCFVCVLVLFKFKIIIAWVISITVVSIVIDIAIFSDIC